MQALKDDSQFLTSKLSANALAIRVLFVSHAYVVGVNQGKLAAIANSGNVTVGLLAPSNWKALEWNRVINLETPFPNIRIYSAPVLFTGRVGAHIYAPWMIWQVINDFRPDIIQVEEEIFSLCAFEVAVWARLLNKPMAVFGWENIERCLPIPRQCVRDFVMDSTQLYIAGNEDGAQVMRKWAYTGKIEVMPQMGVDTQFFNPKLVQASSNDVLRIGFLGRLATGKGIDLILSAVRQLRDRGLECRIVLCGSGSIEADLRQQAQELKISDWVIWRRGVRHEEVPKEISNFDVLVLPSRSTSSWKEQFGHVLIESMAMGVPVIGSSSGEIPNVIGRSDLVFQEEDVKGLAAILERMICEPVWRIEVGKYGIDRVNQLYSHERIAQRLISLWQSILEQKD